MLNPEAQCDGLRRRGLGEMIRSWGGSAHDGTGTLTLSSMWGYSKKMAISEAHHTRNQICWCRDPTTPSLQNSEKETSVIYKPPSWCFFCSGSLNGEDSINPYLKLVRWMTKWHPASSQEKDLVWLWKVKSNLIPDLLTILRLWTVMISSYLYKIHGPVE